MRLAEAPDQKGAANILRVPTQSELAARIGTNRETVTREFSLLVRERLVVKEGRRIVIPSISKLAERIKRYSQTA